MAKAGQVFENPKSGEVIKFLKTSADTKGEYVMFELICNKKGGVPFEHIHPLQSETFIVQEGSVYLKLSGKEYYLKSGDQKTVHPGTPHTFLNREDTPLRAVVEVRPALAFEHGIETIFGLAQDGKCDVKGQPKFFQMAVLLHQSKGEFYLTNMPIQFQKFLFAILGRIGRWMGYKAFYKKYSGFEV